MDAGIHYQPTQNERDIVQALSAFGHAHPRIAAYLNMHVDTLRKHFRQELDFGRMHLEYKCAKRLFDCIDDDYAKDKDRNDAAKFYLARMAGWSEKIEQTSPLDSFVVSAREEIDRLREGLNDARKAKIINTDVEDVSSNSSG